MTGYKIHVVQFNKCMYHIYVFQQSLALHDMVVSSDNKLIEVSRGNGGKLLETQNFKYPPPPKYEIKTQNNALKASNGYNKYMNNMFKSQHFIEIIA